MRKSVTILIVVLLFSSCGSGNATFLGRSIGDGGRSVAPTGKYRNPTMFSRANPFQGRAKAKLANSRNKKKKTLNKNKRHAGKHRKGSKPGRTFSMKRSLPRGRLKTSGSRTKSGGGKSRKNKNLFNTRK